MDGLQCEKQIDSTKLSFNVKSSWRIVWRGFRWLGNKTAGWPRRELRGILDEFQAKDAPWTSTAKPLSEPGAEILSPFTQSLVHLKRGLLMGEHDKFIMGYQSQGGRPDLDQIIAFKKCTLVVYPNETVDFPGCFVQIPYVLCVRGCHMKPPGAWSEMRWGICSVPQAE